MRKSLLLFPAANIWTIALSYSQLCLQSSYASLLSPTKTQIVLPNNTRTVSLFTVCRDYIEVYIKSSERLTSASASACLSWAALKSLCLSSNSLIRELYLSICSRSIESSMAPLSSSYSRQATPSSLSRSSHPRHHTHTPFIIIVDLMCTCRTINTLLI